MSNEIHPLELVAVAVRQAQDAGYSWQQIREVLGDPPATPALPAAAELARTIIDDLAHARWADVSARFDPVMRDGLPDEQLAQGWEHIAGLAGAYQSHGDTDAVRLGDFTTTNTPLTFTAGGFVARISFRDDRTIAGLYILDPDAAAAQTR